MVTDFLTKLKCSKLFRKIVLSFVPYIKAVKTGNELNKYDLEVMCSLLLWMISIGNHIISRAIWNKYARVNIFKD